MLPSPAVVQQQAGRVGLDVVDDFAFGPDYGRTLARWGETFEARVAEVRALGFPDRFIRMWRFYLAYCEAGFNTGDIDVRHYTFAHAAAR
jgi:cyclopropane-fatty-acyl-phospholipid synthase